MAPGVSPSEQSKQVSRLTSSQSIYIKNKTKNNFHTCLDQLVNATQHDTQSYTEAQHSHVVNSSINNPEWRDDAAQIMK